MTPAAPLSSTPPRFFLPRLDGLRFIAFAFVFLHHALSASPSWWVEQAGVSSALSEWLSSAVVACGYGVDVFFALSAYLVTELLLRERDARGAVEVRAFYVRRILRIWPLFFVALAAGAVVDRVVLRQPGMSVGLISAFVLFVGNWGVALGGMPLSVAAPLWSISVEEQFYALYPLTMRRLPVKSLAVVAGVVWSASIVIRAAATFGAFEHPFIWVATVTRLDPFCAGVLAACAMRSARMRLPWVAVLSVLVVTLVVFEQLFPTTEQGLVRAVVAYPLIAALCGGLVLSVASGAGGGVLETRSLVALGRVSYGLYVWHTFALALVLMVETRVGEWLPVGLISAPITAALAFLSYRMLERPFLTLKAKWSRVESRAP